MSFAVTQRTREMGVRPAPGAQGPQLIALIMRKSVLQLALAIGLVAGLALAMAASGLLQPVLVPRESARRDGVRGRRRYADAGEPPASCPRCA
jgi:hypothetical protein